MSMQYIKTVSTAFRRWFFKRNFNRCSASAHSLLKSTGDRQQAYTTNRRDNECDGWPLWLFCGCGAPWTRAGGSRGAKLKSTWNQNRTLPCNDRILWKLTLQQQKYTKPRLITFATRYKTAQNDLFLYVNKRNARTGQEDRTFNCIITKHLVKFGPRLGHSGRSLI